MLSVKARETADTILKYLVWPTENQTQSTILHWRSLPYFTQKRQDGFAKFCFSGLGENTVLFITICIEKHCTISQLHFSSCLFTYNYSS